MPLHYDGTKYSTPKPVDFPLIATKELRIQDMWVGASVYPDDYINLPLQADVEAAIDALNLQPGELMWHDIEHWSGVTDQTKLETVYSWIYNYAHSVEPACQVGCYGLPCVFSYNDPRQPYGSANHTSWLESQATYLVHYLDVLMPQCYHFYRDLPEHEKFITEYMRVARAIAGNRKVIPFLWFAFHEGADFGRDAIISSVSQSAPPVVVTNGAEPVSNAVNGDYVKLYNMNEALYEKKYFYIQNLSATDFSLYDLNNSPVDGSSVSYLATGNERIEMQVPVDHFIRGLEIADEQADGFIVWGGGWQQPWIDNLPWYQTLQQHLGV